MIPPSTDPARSGCSGTAMGFAGKMHPFPQCFPSRTFLLEMQFSWSRCRRQGAGLRMAPSPSNRNTPTAQPRHYLCQGIGRLRRRVPMGAGHGGCNEGGISGEASPEIGEGNSRTFGCSNLVLVLCPRLQEQGKAGGEDTHPRRTNLDGPGERCPLAHSPRSTVTKSTRMRCTKYYMAEPPSHPPQAQAGLNINHTRSA